MTQSFVEQMEILVNNAILVVNEKINEKGKDSEDFNFPVIDVSHLDINFSESVMYVTHEIFIDSRGLQYSFYALETEEFLKIADFVDSL